jgi:hypothetical protein
MIFESAVRRVPSRILIRFPSACSAFYRAAGISFLFLSLVPQVAFAADPFAEDQGVSTNEDTLVGITLVATDADGDSLEYTIDTLPSNGVLGGTPPDVTYTPNPNYNGDDSFTFFANDGTTNSNTATVSITVNPVNDVPTANPDVLVVDEDSTGTDPGNQINVLANDDDPDGGGLSVTSASAVTGSVAVLGNNTVRYTPRANFFGPDTINYAIEDSSGDPSSSIVAVTVLAVPDAPVAQNQPNVTTDEDVAVGITLLATDADGDSLDYTIDTLPSNGVLSGTPPIVTYTPNENFNGGDSFTFFANDGTTDSNTATVSIDVRALNDAPVAQDQPNVTTDEDIAVGITLVATDVDGDSLDYTIDTLPSNGVLSGTPPNVSYTPNANFSGSDSFTFFANDGTTNSNTATVSISVGALNDAPVAQDQPSVTTEEDAPVGITLVATDDDGDTLTYSIVDQPTNGTLIGGAPNLTYTPNENFNGTDSFTFQANDGIENSNIATVTIAVAAVNDAPVAQDQPGVVTDEDTAVNIVLVATDDDDDTLTYTIVGQTVNGVLTGSAPNVIYTPDPNFSGSDSFTFRANDGTADSNLATVTITIASVEDPPQAENDAPPAIDEGGSINGTFNVLDNDDNPETTPMTMVVVTPPSNAAVFTPNTDGTFVYTHDGSETTSDSFTYRANNGQLSNIATVTFTINPVNDAPAFLGVLPPGLSTPEDTTLTISVSALNIDDPDSDPSTFVLTLDPVVPPNANYTLAGPASITPAENFNGSLNVRATVSDGELVSDPFLIPVTVTAVNDQPVLDAEIGPQTAIENSLFELNVFDNFSDADGDTLTFSATGLPASGRITIDPATGIISGTPTIQDARDNEPYVVTVTATDPPTAINPDGTSVSDEFNLTVSALDRANINLSIDVTPESGLPDDQLTWTFTAANPIGPAPGENVELTGSFFGDGLSVAAGGTSNCSISLQAGRADFTCAIGALPRGSVASVSFTTAASQATEVVAFGTVAGALEVPIDPDTSDNSAVRAVGVAESFSDGAVQFLGASTIRSVAAGDLDGDGTTDLVVGTAAGQPVQVYLGDNARESCGCQRDFIGTPISIPDTGTNNGIAVADFDNDGDLDIVIANGGGQPDAVYTNDGAGNFALATTLLLPLPPPDNLATNGRGVAVGDFNNDGNMDIAIAATSPNPVYFGDGAGGFPTGTVLGNAESFGVAAGRFDGDLFDDLVFANVGSDSQVWLSDGGGTFSAGELLRFGDAASVAAADLNADRLDDIVLGRVPAGPGDIPANPVLLNQGGGNFGAPFAELGISPTNDVLIGDVSDDGIPDIVFINASGLHQTWIGDGTGYALHAEQIIDIGARTGVLAELGFADTDDPGGVDLAMGGELSAGLGVYLNDSNGNLGLGDSVAPIITLSGAASVDIASGSGYSDAGATAFDNIDGDISANIVVNNPVNTAVVGSYTVTYNVRDLAGNPAVQVTRTVNVTAATGRGGGGGGALGVWAIVLLIGACLVIFVRAPDRTRQAR